MTEPLGALPPHKTIETAVIYAACPVDGCTVKIPMRAGIERLDEGNVVLSFTSTAVRAHVMLSHREETR